MEIFGYIAVAALVVFFVARITLDANSWLNRKIDIRVGDKIEKSVQSYVKLSYLDLEKRLSVNPGNPENADLRQTVAKDIAKTEEILQNEVAPVPPVDFWKDTTLMRGMRDSLNTGNHDDYKKIDELSGLGPLDALHFLDQKILEREEQLQHVQA